MAATENIMNEPERTRYRNALFLNSLISLEPLTSAVDKRI